ncbi:MAG: SPOR domain-containing protein [Sphingomonas sp.]|nr:SPOR domain-containing protein [Sphingomonas sp.]
MPRRRGDETESDAVPEGETGTVDFRETADEDRLPWLEAVEEESEGSGPGLAKLIGAVVIGLLAIGLIVGGLFWLGNRGESEADGTLIAAPEGDYKVRPDDPGGMNVAGEGDTAYAASAGRTPEGRLNTDTVPEAPVARPEPAPKAAPPATAAQTPAPPPQAPAASGGTIQLGAFSSQASANRAWSGLSGRFRYLAPLSHNVVAVQSGERTLYRLRASGPDAAGICRRLRVAGEDCTIVG